MKIAILSDSHDNWVNLDRAANIANDLECGLLLHAGDLIAPPMMDILHQFKGPVSLVLGNNDGEVAGLVRKADKYANVYLEGLMVGNYYESEIDGLQIFMNHYPVYSKIAAETGRYDLCIFGHTHEYHEERVGKTLLLNPGEIMGQLTGQAGFVVFETRTGEAERLFL